MWKGKVNGFLDLHAHAEPQSKKQLSEKIALSEAFADLTALFAILAQTDMCEAAVVFSKGNLTWQRKIVVHSKILTCR